MVVLTWITLVQRAWTLLFVVLATVLTTVVCPCPGDVSSKAHSCFTHYSFHFKNMQNSPQKLCCGVDVEILRAFCQSYTAAMTCVRKLKDDCSEDSHPTIDKALNNLNEVQAELQELCSDDVIIENYAMYQTCYTLAGSESEMCLRAHLNSSNSANIKFLSKVSIHGMDQFCREMRNTVECVKRNIKMVCGDEAAQLVDILVKPMVRQSTECDYSVINDQQKNTKRPHHGHHAYISDDHSSTDIKGGSSRSNANTRNGSNCLRIASPVIVLLVLFYALLAKAVTHR